MLNYYIENTSSYVGRVEKYNVPEKCCAVVQFTGAHGLFSRVPYTVHNGRPVYVNSYGLYCTWIDRIQTCMRNLHDENQELVLLGANL